MDALLVAGERRCLYCARKIAAEDRVAMCNLCYVGHHEECWLRNGRCSTFRCPGTPRLMAGAEYAYALAAALEMANSEPRACPLCGERAYAGRVYVRKTQSGENPIGTVLPFVVVRRVASAEGGVLRRLASKLARTRQWLLSGAQLHGRSCGNCRTLFLWGAPVDDVYLINALEQARDRFCVYCGVSMWTGEIRLTDARFWSESVPEFHREWLLHNLLDRFVYNRWQVRVKAIPASSCPQCRYTEVCGRPVYRFG